MKKRETPNTVSLIKDHNITKELERAATNFTLPMIDGDERETTKDFQTN